MIFQVEKIESLIVNLTNKNQYFSPSKLKVFQESPFSKVLYGLDPDEGIFICDENIPKLALDDKTIIDFCVISPYILNSLSYDCIILNKNNEFNLQNMNQKEITLNIENNVKGNLKYYKTD